MALPAASATAASGDITRAEANSGWTSASLAGSATWGECIHPSGWGSSTKCSWRPYLTIGSGSEPEDCASADRRRSELGESVTLVWEADLSTSSGSTEFDLNEVPISETDELVCLGLVEYLWEPYPCPDGVPCVEIIGNSMTRFPVLAAARLSAPESEEEPAAEVSAAPPPEDQAGPTAIRIDEDGVDQTAKGSASGRPNLRRCGKGRVRRHNRCVRTRILARRACRKRHGRSKRRCVRRWIRKLNRAERRRVRSAEGARHGFNRRLR